MLTSGTVASNAADVSPRPADAMVQSQPEVAFQITPYVWATGLQGDVSPFRRVPTVQVEKSFSDIFDDLNFAGFVNLYGRYGRWVLSGDVMYVNLSESETVGPLPYVGAIGAEFDTVQFSATLQAGYRLVDTDRFTFDVLGGARRWHLWNDLKVSAAGRQFTVESNYGWTDPLIGARAHLHLNRKFSLLAQGDIGGFGVGADTTWQALATANYNINDRFSVSLGYKALYVDYDNDGHVFQSTLSGPVAGVTFRF
ncbi:hypothetical protein DCO57_16845 [Labrenzia sp. 011]|nr:hypothetical protein DCO57_16845 [Labrenzia sp. 011]